MNYYINPTAFSAAFTVPADVVDRHLKLARGEHIKVLLYLLRRLSAKTPPEEIAAATGLSVYDVTEALLYWADAGILLPEEAPTVKAPAEEKPKAVKRVTKPTRADVSKRGAEDEKIRFLLQETQLRLGRALKSNEASTLVWLYDDEGLDVSLILMIVQYAATHNRMNIRFIESTAIDWINKGIDSVAAADDELRSMALSEEAWRIVSSAFGLARRRPSKKEAQLSTMWINEWKLSKEMLAAAYDACVDATSDFSFPYAAKILESWHKSGYQTPDEIKPREKEAEQKGFAAYDIDMFEQMLNTKD